ncbi:hypothetical protein HTZ84_00015 [Haloterrigena sp. SYSU A558-1]|uniref:Uncharacterized protein n=1 Tax=Haloterrigena gelatinilytica TaxID=2741724 RepID=A0ABX2LD92_9EURY|nr:hypothetical protein [Haloterrigena gelatinilytica]NUC70711.1 hypothetical protein [Haloterrigena gelatinilytica]
MSQRGGGPGAQFDWQGYLEQTTRSERERLEERLEAKKAQIRRRTKTYEAAVTDLQTALQDVEHQLSRAIPTRDRRQELKRRRNRLQSDLRETRRRFADDIRQLEDTVLELEAELEELCEAEELLENAVTQS